MKSKELEDLEKIVIVDDLEMYLNDVIQIQSKFNEVSAEISNVSLGALDHKLHTISGQITTNDVVFRAKDIASKINAYVHVPFSLEEFACNVNMPTNFQEEDIDGAINFNQDCFIPANYEEGYIGINQNSYSFGFSHRTSYDIESAAKYFANIQPNSFPEIYFSTLSENEKIYFLQFYRVFSIAILEKVERLKHAYVIVRNEILLLLKKVILCCNNYLFHILPIQKSKFHFLDLVGNVPEISRLINFNKFLFNLLILEKWKINKSLVS